jgi:hypothetical protein
MALPAEGSVHRPCNEPGQEDRDALDPQQQVIEELIALTDAAGIPTWFYGSYALHSLEGHATRPHGDIDFFTRFQDQDRLRQALSSTGFELVKAGSHWTTYTRRDQWINCNTFKRLDNGTPVTDAGEEGVWPWPDNSFPDEPNGVLFGKPVRALSLEGQYIFKAGFQVYDPREPLRDKDRQDLEIICRRIPPEMREKLALLFYPLPGTRKRYPGEKNG